MVAVPSSGTAMLTLPTDEQILIAGVRCAQAPRVQGVYHARARQALVAREARRVTIAEIDLRVGGNWRYVMVIEGGVPVGFHGEYREIVPNWADRLDRGLRGPARACPRKGQR